jgi:hypothetical protein
LRSVSLRPTDENWSTGGRAHATLKNECGAMLSTPRADRDATHATGRGVTTAVSSP